MERKTCNAPRKVRCTGRVRYVTNNQRPTTNDRPQAIPIVLFDTHCHLDFESFHDDVAAVVERAAAVGVTRIVVPALDLDNAAAVLALAERFPGVYAAVGVHPNSAAGWRNEWIDDLRALAAHEKVVAIGEIGLDYYWDKTPQEIQHRALARQLDLALEIDLPVIIHNREASEDVVRMLAAAGERGSGGARAQGSTDPLPNPLPLEEGTRLSPLAPSEPVSRNSYFESPLVTRHSSLATPLRGVLHSFSADWVTAEAALAMGFYLGFTGPLTYKKADDLREIAARVPLDRLLIETDAPFLAPHPFRGKRNEPAYVRLVAERLADLRGLSLEKVAAATTANGLGLFGMTADG